MANNGGFEDISSLFNQMINDAAGDAGSSGDNSGSNSKKSGAPDDEDDEASGRKAHSAQPIPKAAEQSYEDIIRDVRRSVQNHWYIMYEVDSSGKVVSAMLNKNHKFNLAVSKIVNNQYVFCAPNPALIKNFDAPFIDFDDSQLANYMMIFDGISVSAGRILSVVPAVFDVSDNGNPKMVTRGRLYTDQSKKVHRTGDDSGQPSRKQPGQSSGQPFGGGQPTPTTNTNPIGGRQPGRSTARPMPAGRRASKPETEPAARSSTFRRTANGTEVRPRKTQRVIVIDPKTVTVAIKSKNSPLRRISKVMYETSKGTSFAFKMYWDAVLEEIDKVYPDRKQVKTIGIIGNKIMINKRQFDFGNLLEEQEIDMEDIISIKSLFKRYKNVKDLILDYPSFNVLLSEYGVADGSDYRTRGARAVRALFESSKRLTRLGALKRGGHSDEDINWYYREKLSQATEQINNDVRHRDAAMALEQAMAMQNPRIAKKSPAYKQKFTSGAWEFSKDRIAAIKKHTVESNNALVSFVSTAVSLPVALGITVVQAVWFKLTGKVPEYR